MAFTKLQGLGEAFKKLSHKMDDHADKLYAAMDATSERGDKVFDRAHKTIQTNIDAHLDEVNKYMDDLERATNGGPLADSQT